MMQVKQAIEKKLEELKRDERVFQKTANVFTNAPLALIQCDLYRHINTLEWVLGLQLSKFPLKKQDHG